MSRNLPTGWSARPLEKVATLQRGFDLPIQTREEGKVPVYGSNGIDGWHSRAAVSGPGVITGRSGTIGSVYFETRDYWPLNTTLYVRDFHGNEPRFVARMLESLDLKRFAASTGVPSLNRNFVHPTPVILPPPDEQSRIAAVLDTVDETIAKTEAVIAKLKQMRAGLLHDLLTRGLDEHGQLRDPIAHPERFQDSPLGRIPREWEVLPLEQVAEVDRGKFTHRPRNDPAFYGGRFPFIQTGDVALTAGETITEASQSLNDRGVSVSKEFPLGTIAVTIAANIGDTTILGRPMYFPDSVVGVVVHKPHSIRWIELALRRAKQRLFALAPQSAQKNINLEFLRPLLIPIPPSREQERCTALYETMSNQIRAESKTFEKLNLLKSGLMTDLLTGRVRVPAHSGMRRHDAALSSYESGDASPHSKDTSLHSKGNAP